MDTNIISALPPAIPESLPVHDPYSQHNITELHPFGIDPSVRTLELEYIIHPVHNAASDDLKLHVSAHFHGVSHSQGPQSRHPYVTTVRETERCPIPGVHISLSTGVPGAHSVYCKAKLAEIPFGVSCVLLTASSMRLDLIQRLEINVYTFRYVQGQNKVRRKIGFKQVSASDIQGILQMAKAKEGTLTLSMLVQNAGWWHLYSKQSFFRQNNINAFEKEACKPRADGAPTPVEKLLSYLPMYKPLARRIRVAVDEAYQLAVPTTGFFGKLGLKANDNYVQSRIRGIFRGEDFPQPFVTAQSRKPILDTRVTFQYIPWAADQVLCSDSRFIEVMLLNSPQGQVGDYNEHDIQSDPRFLGVATFDVAQVWALLPNEERDFECKLRLKLGPASNRLCTGTVVVSIRVSREPFDVGVAYQS